MYCKLKQEQCIACGRCQRLDPHHFDYNENGIIVFSNTSDTSQILTDHFDEFNEAYKQCPTHAITILKH